jgi:hypothetical protein
MFTGNRFFEVELEIRIFRGGRTEVFKTLLTLIVISTTRSGSTHYTTGNSEECPKEGP